MDFMWISYGVRWVPGGRRGDAINKGRLQQAIEDELGRSIEIDIVVDARPWGDPNKGTLKLHDGRHGIIQQRIGEDPPG